MGRPCVSVQGIIGCVVGDIACIVTRVQYKYEVFFFFSLMRAFCCKQAVTRTKVTAPKESLNDWFCCEEGLSWSYFKIIITCMQGFNSLFNLFSRGEITLSGIVPFPHLRHLFLTMKASS